MIRLMTMADYPMRMVTFLFWYNDQIDDHGRLSDADGHLFVFFATLSIIRDLDHLDLQSS
jgi:hypothetical protein